MSKLEDVAALLRGEQPQPEGEDDGRRPEEDTAGQEVSEPEQQEDKAQAKAEEPERRSVKDLADKLGLEAKQLYQTLEVALPNDRVYTLGELKDLAVKGIQAGKTTQANQQAATDLLVQRRELQRVAEHMQQGGQITQEAADQLAKYEERRKSAEVQNFLKSVPEWSDAPTRDREVAAITAAAARYGLSQPELDALVTDSRLMKLVRDFAVATPAEPKVIGTRRAPAPAPTRTGNSRKDMLSQISQLLR